MNAPTEQFRDAIQAAGIQPPDAIIADGALHRFASDGKRGDDAGWYVLHEDGIPAGSFGCFRANLSLKWHADIGRKLSPVEASALRTKSDADRLQREAVEAQRRAEAATKAMEIWAAAQPAGADHPYLARKHVSPVSTLREIPQTQAATILGYQPKASGGLLTGRLLIAPVKVSDGMATVEMIDEAGRKSAVAGGAKRNGYWAAQPLPEGDGTDLTLLIGEGVATVLSAGEATGHPTVASLSCGNLESVARQMRARYPAARLIILADLGNGQAEAEKAARAIAGLFAAPDFGVDRPDGATDFNDMQQLCGREAVEHIINDASPRGPEAQPATPSRPGHEPDGEEVEEDGAAIIRLAAMEEIEYDRVRVAEATRLRIRPATLDKLVKKESAKAGADTGLVVPFREREPWPEPVVGAELLADLVATLRRFAVMPPHADTAIALWVVMTHATEHTSIAPMLALCSPEKRCGKTTVMSLVAGLVHRPLAAANITAAALFRSVEAWGPTLLIDEADTFVRSSDELRGILNSGHSRATAFVIRTAGEDHEPRQFSTWGAKCIALIGRLPDTLADRSIRIELRRRLPYEKVEKLRLSAHGDLFDDLASRCARFVADHKLDFHRIRPALPESINDRAADNWEPLLTIAAIAGGDWPQEAMRAALSLSGAEQENKSVGVDLLHDIQHLFGSSGRDRIKSVDLIASLCDDDERPWATYNHGNAISARQVATRLREFGVVGGTIRLGAETAKGYTKEQFDDAFARYLGQPVGSSVTPSQVNTGGVLDGFERRNAGALLLKQESLEAGAGVGCDGVTDR